MEFSGKVYAWYAWDLGSIVGTTKTKSENKTRSILMGENDKR